MGLLKKREQPTLIAEISVIMADLAEKAKVNLCKCRSRADLVRKHKPKLSLWRKGWSFSINSGLWKGYRLHDLYAKAMTPWEWHKPLLNMPMSWVLH